MKLAVWEPFREMDHFHARSNPAHFWPPGRALPKLANTRLQWAVSTDNGGADQDCLVRAELPAVRSEDVQVTLRDGTPAIHGKGK